jgi:hypothetical protein
MNRLQYSLSAEEKGKNAVVGSPTDYDALSSTSSPQFHTIFASMSMHMSDRLRLLRFPSADIESVHSAINASWPRGVQDIREHYGSHEFKLKGNPWSGQSDEAIFARRMMCKILETLSNTGWVLAVTADISKRTTEKDTLIFRYQQPPPATCDWMSISFSLQDRIRLIDAPEELIQYLVSCLGRFIQRHKRHKLEGTYELQIHGYPWRAPDNKIMESRLLLLQLLEGLDAKGWTVYASIDQKTGPTGDTSWSEPDTVSPRLSTSIVRIQYVKDSSNLLLVALLSTHRLDARFAGLSQLTSWPASLA